MVISRDTSTYLRVNRVILLGRRLSHRLGVASSGLTRQTLVRVLVDLIHLLLSDETQQVETSDNIFQ